jgi:hypothetical protein
VFNPPEFFLTGRLALGFDQVAYGVGGILLMKPSELEEGQVGYSVDPRGKTLAGDGDGDWRSDWIVIGSESACGDPIFMSIKPPYQVFTAIHGEDSWDAKLVAPSLDNFWKCLSLFREMARGRSDPAQLEANPPDDREIQAYLKDIDRLCGGQEDAVDFWSAQAEIGREADGS